MVGARLALLYKQLKKKLDKIYGTIAQTLDNMKYRAVTSEGKNEI